MELATKPKQQTLDKVSCMLTALLAEEFSLYSKTRIAHWNVEGFDFYYKHTFFEDQYKQLDELVERVAERLRAIGDYTPATAMEILQQSQCNRAQGCGNDGRSLVKELLYHQEELIEHLRYYLKALEDELYQLGGRDFIADLLDAHEKMAWMLRAHLK
ncbi:starvation-inducible DNA-binding protein [Filimonas zeae]|uniref:DNA starvation/stationary phase protection protein n=1 Tax=Filimonas zeae TaxID=1737353 RepID=A0A917MX79_9BACT|nr:DNA starvation/stationary phase protection protein [Filimonas zeae]MDR6340716.1 starvation-inducible DNA-binding protein [Filimonas zeae]GGH74037.1 DNA starvation/stationary phase protection protein [Filimonas zeae]